MCTHTHLSDCMAGGGRAGTLIGMYLMKHLDFTANEAIGGLRACSVLFARSASSAPSSKHTVYRTPHAHVYAQMYCCTQGYDKDI